jgi:CheY-like chemotaxis protein
MKIFIVEDEPASIESARIQLGQDHELVFFTTAMEVIEKLLECQAIEKQKPDLILTDVNIPMGDPGSYSVKEHYLPNDSIPAGLVVALRSVLSKLPCLIVTNSNSHEDLIGLLLDKAGFNYGSGMRSHTRPGRIDTSIGKGKDWGNLIKYYGGMESLIEILTSTEE